jgi:hypothetical protein
MVREEDIGPGESPQVDTRAILKIIAVLVAALVLISFGLELFFQDRIGRTYTVSHAFPPPGVIPNEREQRRALDARQRRELNGEGGHMPIGAAMKAVSAKGPHAFDPVGGGQ